MEDESNNPNQGDWLSETKDWIQDNIRIVLSIVIVLAIAFGVYSYSRRGAEEAAQVAGEETTELTDLQSLIEEGEQADQTEEIAEVIEEPSTPIESDQPIEQPQTQEQSQPEQEIAIAEPLVTEESEMEQPATEQPNVIQSGDAYEVSAATGDSLTTLARSALRQHMSANNDPSITAEHKIYIEDYLAHQKGYGGVEIGETQSFTQQEIQEAVDAAKQLSQSQLDHLKVYSQRVPGL